MERVGGVTRSIVLALALCVTAGNARAGREAPVLPLSAQVEGEGYEQLSMRWWQWAFSFPDAMAPYRDPDGRLCDIGQQGPVWFLAGTDGRDWVQRRCVVPTGMHLFLPIINMFHRSASPVPSWRQQVACDSLRRSSAVNNDSLSSAQVLIDGVPLRHPERFRVRTSTCFDPFPTTGSDKASGYLGASDGYWLLLPPLSPGRHTIAIGANYGNTDSADAYSDMLQNFEYILEVGGESI